MGYKYYPDVYFTTASIFRKEHLLEQDFFRSCLLDAFEFVSRDRVYIFAFVIMSNHFHIIWQLRDRYELSQVQHSILSFTAKSYLHHLKVYDTILLNKFYVNKSDRLYQFWQRDPLSIGLRNDKIINQKMNYIHENPTRARIVKNPEDFMFSSFRSYMDNDSKWSFLTLL